MNTNVSFTEINTAIANFLHRYHVVLFAILAFGSLSVATYLLNLTIVHSTEITQTNQSTTFDQDTINKIKQLNTLDEAEQESVNPPISARNPFVE